MRIVHVITRLIVGGAQENTIASVLGLQRKSDVEVSLISGRTEGPEGSLEGVLREGRGHLEIVGSLVRPVSPIKDLAALTALTRRFREQQPDIVHTHSGKAGVLGRLAAARAGVPTIVHSIHGPSFGPFQGRLANFCFLQAERVAGKVTSHFVVVANAMRDQYLRAGIGLPEQYTRIFSGFELEPFLSCRSDESLRGKLGLRRNDIVVGTIGRLFKLKGHEELIAVAPELIRAEPRLKFLWIGDGSLRETLERKIRGAGLRDHFIFTGLVRPEEVPPLVGIMDMLVHLSRREGLARALPQALAAGKPVIAYDCDGAGEVCLDEKTGFLIPVGGQALLTGRILQLARDAKLRNELGTAGKQLVSSQFSTERMVEELYRLYVQLSRR